MSVAACLASGILCLFTECPGKASQRLSMARQATDIAAEIQPQWDS